MHPFHRLAALSLVSATLAIAQQPAPKPPTSGESALQDALDALNAAKRLPPGESLLNQDALNSLKIQITDSLDDNPMLLAMQTGEFPDFRDFSFPGMRAESRIAPPGLWWRKPDIVQTLNLTTDQQKRMDDIVQQNRIQLIDLKANLEKQQVIMEPLLAANPPDTKKVLEQIDNTAQARADLEKSNAKMLLALRGVLTADQWTKLQDIERERRPGDFRMRVPRGPKPPTGHPGNDDNPSPAPAPAPATPPPAAL